MTGEPRAPFDPGTATGVGSLPGTEPGDAVRIALGEVPLPFVPELPARGAGSDLAGRSAALLAGLPVDLQPGGWRLVERPSREGRRAQDDLARDLDALQEAAGDAPPDVLKVQCAGPWTLASLLDLPRGEPALADTGAVRDVVASLAEGLALHLADLARRLPGTRLLLQLDEPSLPAVLLSRVPTSSGYGTVLAPAASVAVEHLAAVLAVGAPDHGAAPAQPDGSDATSRPVSSAGLALHAASPAVHCCAAAPPIALLRRAGARTLSLDATLLGPADDDALGAAVEDGAGLLLGCVPATDGPLPTVDDALAPVRRLWRRLGLPADRLPGTVALSPTCGLAGASAAYARAALQRCREAAAALQEEPL